jgi:uncharacterized protein (DUF1778 family)
MPIKVKKTFTVRWADDYTHNMANYLAEISGQSINAVVMEAVRYYGEHFLNERKNAIKEFGPIVLSPKDYESMMETLENPPDPNDILKRAATKYKKMNIEHKDS